MSGFNKGIAGPFAVASMVLVLAGCKMDPHPENTLEGPLNLSYRIAGQAVRLVDGEAVTEAAPGSAAQIVTRYFGNELRHDVDGDGREDVVFLLTQQTGGGTWFYVVAGLNRPDGWIGSEGMLLGDRIAPQSIVAGPGDQVIVNFADRPQGEPFTEPPSLARSLRLRFDPETLSFGSVADDYPGAADPALMTLGMHRWAWTGYVDQHGTAHPVPHGDAFTLLFEDGGDFDATTDCNRLSGAYTFAGHQLSLEITASTDMYCEGSQEGLFTSLLSEVAKFEFTARGELILSFDDRPGKMSFHAALI